MAPRADQRTGQAAFTDGRKRKAPSDGGRDPPRHTTKSKQACGADRGRLKDGKPGSTSIARGSGKPGPKAKCVRFAGDGKCQAKQNAKGKSAIDDIFSGVKRLKEEQAEEEAERLAHKKKLKDEHKRRQANPFTGEGAPEKRWAWADDVKPVRFDDDGLPIYTWESLRIGQGGGTDLCPFDCDCCF